MDGTEASDRLLVAGVSREMAGALPSVEALREQLIEDMRRSSGETPPANFELCMRQLLCDRYNSSFRKDISGIVSGLDRDLRTAVAYHVTFGSAKEASAPFLRLLLEESRDIGVCRALVELAKSEPAGSPALLRAAGGLLRAAGTPCLVPLCRLVLESREETWTTPFPPLAARDPRQLFPGDDAFLKGVMREGAMQEGGADLAGLMVTYALTGDAFGCRRAARAAAAADAVAAAAAALPPALLACVPLLTGEAAGWTRLLQGLRDDDASWPLPRCWTALGELRPTLVLDGERPPEGAERGALRVAVRVASGRLVLRCGARTDCMFPRLDWLTHAFLARNQERGLLQDQDGVVTLDLLEDCPATAALPSAAGSARPGLPTAAALQALLIAAHPGMRTDEDEGVDGRVFAAALSPRLATALPPEAVRRLVRSVLVPHFPDPDPDPDPRDPGRSMASTMAALSDRLSAFPEEFIPEITDAAVAPYVRDLGRPLTPAETLIVRRISPAVRRWSRIVGYAAHGGAGGEGGASQQVRGCIRAVLGDADDAERRAGAGAPLDVRKRRRAEDAAAAGRGECLAAMERVLGVAADLRAAAAGPGGGPRAGGDSACGRLLLIAAWQDAVNSHSGGPGPAA